MKTFNPEKVWIKSLTWDNHHSFIRSKKEDADPGVHIERRGFVSVPGRMIGVHAAEWQHPENKGFSFTQLSAVNGNTKYTVTFRKCYSEQYCVTLAKRFARKIDDGEYDD